MNQEAWNILELSAEAAVAVRGGRLVFANREARRLLGDNCVGEQAKALLLPEYAELPEGAAVMDTEIGGAAFALRFAPQKDGLLVFLTRQSAPPELLNDAFLFKLRDSLQTLSGAADDLRERTEKLGEAAMLESMAVLTRGLCKLLRQTENAELARSLHTHDQPFRPQELDLSLLCHALLDAVETHLPALRIRREIPSGVYLVADARLLRSLLLNLISNALLHGRAQSLCLTLQSMTRHVLLTLRDDGVGIPEDSFPTVFSRCGAELPLSELQKGCGLGLSAARAIARLHQGTLLIEGQEGAGAVVRVSLSRAIEPSGLRCPRGEKHSAELCTMRELQSGLAECLPVSAFREQYMD